MFANGTINGGPQWGCLGVEVVVGLADLVVVVTGVTEPPVDLVALMVAVEFLAVTPEVGLDALPQWRTVCKTPVMSPIKQGRKKVKEKKEKEKKGK